MSPSKAITGIEGFDDITHGGLPRGRTTVLEGGPGSGDTLFALRFLVHGAQEYDEPGIFVAFEETSKRIVANAESFNWKLAELQRKKLFFLDAQPTPDLIQWGNSVAERRFSYWTFLDSAKWQDLVVIEIVGVPYGSRTRVAAVKEKPPIVTQRNLAAWIALYRI
ncbi:MAG: circadian clock protein KaiC [Blastocatellia bacterium]|nr:circadian clock protein KaiC [Blastocatellia bacterium]